MLSNTQHPHTTTTSTNSVSDTPTRCTMQGEGLSSYLSYTDYLIESSLTPKVCCQGSLTLGEKFFMRRRLGNCGYLISLFLESI